MTLNEIFNILIEEEKKEPKKRKAVKNQPVKDIMIFLGNFLEKEDPSGTNNQKLLSLGNEYVSLREKNGPSYSANDFFKEKKILPYRYSNSIGKLDSALKNTKKIYHIKDETISDVVNKIRVGRADVKDNDVRLPGVKLPIKKFFKKDPTGNSFLLHMKNKSKREFMKNYVKSASTERFDRYLKEVLVEMGKDENFINDYIEKIELATNKGKNLKGYILANFSNNGKFGKKEIDKLIEHMVSKKINIDRFMQEFGYTPRNQRTFYETMDKIINNEENSKYLREKVKGKVAKEFGQRSGAEVYFSNKFEDYIKEKNPEAEVSFNKMFYSGMDKSGKKVSYDSDIFVSFKDGSKYAIFWDGSPHLVPYRGNDILIESIKRNISKIKKARELGIKVHIIEYMKDFTITRVEKEFEKFKKVWENRDSLFNGNDEKINSLIKRINFVPRYDLVDDKIKKDKKEGKITNNYYYSNDTLINKLIKYTERNKEIKIHYPKGDKSNFNIMDGYLSDGTKKYAIIWSSKAPKLDRTITDKSKNFEEYLKSIETFFGKIRSIKKSGYRIIILKNIGNDKSGDYETVEKIINSVENGHTQEVLDNRFYGAELIEKLNNSMKHNSQEYDKIIELGEQLKFLRRVIKE